MPKKEEVKPKKSILLKLFIGIFIIVFIIVAIFVTKIVYNSIYQSIYDKEVNKVFREYGVNPDSLDPETRQALIDSYLEGGDSAVINEVKGIIESETARITAERTKEITDQILGVKKREPEECNLKPKKREFNKEPYYEGPLIDTHVHMPVASKITSQVAIQSGFLDMPYDGDITIDHIMCVTDTEGIIKTFGLFVAPNLAFSPSIRAVKEYKATHKEKLIVFYMPTPLSNLNPTNDEVQNAIDSNPGLYQGYGEIKFAFDEVPNEDNVRCVFGWNGKTYGGFWL